MTFNDTTNKNGVIQRCEYYCNLGDAAISGTALLLQQFTAGANEALDELAPYLYSFSDVMKWDDSNNTDAPIGTMPSVLNQQSYTIAQDDNSLDILNITKVMVLPSATSTNYTELELLTADDPRAALTMSANSGVSGVPGAVLRRGNVLHFDVPFSFVGSTAIKIFFERETSYFASNDTTKQPGIPKPFHPFVPLHASLQWLLINKPGNLALITRIEKRLEVIKKALDVAIRGRFPARAKMTPRITPYV